MRKSLVSGPELVKAPRDAEVCSSSWKALEHFNDSDYHVTTSLFCGSQEVVCLIGMSSFCLPYQTHQRNKTPGFSR